MSNMSPKGRLVQVSDSEPFYMLTPPSYLGSAARTATRMHINDALRITDEYNKFVADWNERELGENLWVEVWNPRERKRRQELNRRIDRLANAYRSCWGDVCWPGRFPRSALGWIDFIEERFAVIRFDGFRRYDLRTGLRGLADFDKVEWAGWIS